ncbi:unnamed protein product [Clonostachys solani]|uniref:Uncharacterized protein n=1 Tax=Clonostachys solani TaxID=160281 RepID=A0A9N9ZE63_9HYPO|nr:unnamed protein product [Clonostachys solani]
MSMKKLSSPNIQDMLKDASWLFSENYGIWGQLPPGGCSFGKLGE